MINSQCHVSPKYIFKMYKLMRVTIIMIATVTN